MFNSSPHCCVPLQGIRFFYRKINIFLSNFLLITTAQRLDAAIGMNAPRPRKLTSSATSIDRRREQRRQVKVGASEALKT